MDYLTQAAWRNEPDFLDASLYDPTARLVEQCGDNRARKLALIALVGGSLRATDTETASSILWFATIQCIESKQDLAGLAPKDCFIPAKPVERVTGQIGQTQKATCEVGGGIN